MSGKTTLGLVGLFLILSGYVYFFELSGLDAGEAAGDNLPIFDAIYGEYDIRELQIVTAHGSAHFLRTDNSLTQDWQMVAPIVLAPVDLDQARINGAATRLGRLTAGQVISDSSDLTPYGLSPPHLTATLTISNGQQVTLLTGDQTPLNSGRYVRTRSTPSAIFVVPDLAVEALHELLTTPPVRPTPLPTVTPRP